MSWDEVNQLIATYACATDVDFTEEALQTAWFSLLDSLACGFFALGSDDCRRRLSYPTPGTLPDPDTAVPIPGTRLRQDPLTACWSIGCLIRFLDFNDTFLAKEYAHPSDAFAPIIALLGYLSRKGQVWTVKDVLVAAIKSYEIQGVLSLGNSLHQQGMDHVLFLKVACTAVCTALLGASEQVVFNAVTNAWADGGSLRCYRQAPNTGVRKSWAAADATQRALMLAFRAIEFHEAGYPTCLSAPRFGFQDAMMGGQAIMLPQRLQCYVMENILYKISYPAEFHGQTAVECALEARARLNELYGANAWTVDAIASILISTHRAAKVIIDKRGPLTNYADRDHCIQYMMAVALLTGDLRAQDYSDEVANANPAFDLLREKMIVTENEEFSADYLDPSKRSVATSIHVILSDGQPFEAITREYPIGHRTRRPEGIPLLMNKWQNSLKTVFDDEQIRRINTFNDEMSVDKFLALFQ